MPKLANKEICTGCMACMNACPKAAISFEADEEKFLMPFVDERKCVECHLCERACPEVQEIFHQNTGEVDVYAGWNKTDRRVSSSGGAFSSIARYVLEKGGDVYGVTLDEHLICKHIGVDSEEGLDHLRGSKYIQSCIGETFKQAKQKLLADKYVLFTGTPCQISGLKSYLGKDYLKLITIDLICHGVPSQASFNSYLKKLKNRLGKDEGEEFTNYEFRRRDGWGFAPSVTTTMNNCRTLYGVDALYMSAFDKAAIFRKSCYSCHYATTARVGDFSIGDFWGLGHQGIPFKHDMTKGVSLLIVNSEKGREIFKALGNDNFYEQRTLEEAAAGNHNLTKVSSLPENRDLVIKAFLNDNMTLDDIETSYRLIDRSLKKRLSSLSERLGLYDIVKKLYNKIG